MRVFGFEKLVVWQDTRKLSVMIYQLTASFPDSEKYGIISQMRRAAISVASNIAEGSSRSSDKERSHFYRMAYASLMELLNQLIIATDLEMLDENVLNNDIRPLIEKVSSSLYTLKGKT